MGGGEKPQIAPPSPARVHQDRPPGKQRERPLRRPARRPPARLLLGPRLISTQRCLQALDAGTTRAALSSREEGHPVKQRLHH